MNYILTVMVMEQDMTLLSAYLHKWAFWLIKKKNMYYLHKQPSVFYFPYYCYLFMGF